MEKIIVSGTITVQKWTGHAFINPTNFYGGIPVGEKFSSLVSHGERAVAVIHERTDGKWWIDAIFGVDVTRSLEGAFEKAEAWVARHRW